MNGPTSQEYVTLYLGLLDPRCYGYDLVTIKKLLDVCVFQCELAVGDYDLAIHFTPSVVALGCVLNGLEWIMVDYNNDNDNDDDNDEGSISILSEDAQFDFMRRLCELLLLRNSNDDIDDDDDGVDATSVEFVRTMLRRSFRRNSGVVDDDLPSSSSLEVDDDDDEMEEVSSTCESRRSSTPRSSNGGCETDNSDVESKRRRGGCNCNDNKVDRMQCDDDDVKCSSPVSVVVPAS